MYNWIDVDNGFSYLRRYRFLATIVSINGELWMWVIYDDSHYEFSGTTNSLKEAKEKVESIIK